MIILLICITSMTVHGQEALQHKLSTERSATQVSKPIKSVETKVQRKRKERSATMVVPAHRSYSIQATAQNERENDSIINM